jgi:hypothetical protein
MKTSKLRRAAVVLGAGASRGAKVVGGRTPHLDADFLAATWEHFRHGKPDGKDRAGVLAWKALRTHLLHAGLKEKEVSRWRLEQLSTFLEARASLSSLKLNQGHPYDFHKALESLKIVVCHMLLADGGTHACELHTALFQSLSPSVVISFNYDIIADQSLLSLEELAWKQPDYRCARVAQVISQSGAPRSQPLERRSKKFGSPLIKLHGSMHYEAQLKGRGYRLSGIRLPNAKRSTFDYVQVPARPFLIPPVAAKTEIGAGILNARWKAALDYLHNAPSWVIWGYSFPLTDTIAQVLFRTALERNRKPKPVVVVNPDVTVATRVKEVCRKVEITHFSSMERFMLDERELWSVLRES